MDNHTHAPCLDLNDNVEWRQLEARPRNETFHGVCNSSNTGGKNRYRVFCSIRKNVSVNSQYLTLRQFFRLTLDWTCGYDVDCKKSMYNL